MMISHFLRGLYTFLPFIVLVSGDCPNDWVTHDSCYLFSDDTLSWPEAATVCGIFHAKLVEVDSPSERTYLDSVAKQLNRHFWIGAQDIVEEGRFTWESSGNSVYYTHYASGEPNDQDHNEDCVEIRSDGYWNDRKCTEDINYICERSSLSGDEVIG